MGDLSFNSKFRIFARNEEHGNAIIAAENGNGSSCAISRMRTGAD